MDETRASRLGRALQLAILAPALCTFTACGGVRVVDAPSANQSSRVDHLVIHFTSERFAESMRLLTQRIRPAVSAHYLVPAPGTRPIRAVVCRFTVSSTRGVAPGTPARATGTA